MISSCQMCELGIRPKQKVEHIEQPLHPAMLIIENRSRVHITSSAGIGQNVIKLLAVGLRQIIHEIGLVDGHWLELVVFGVMVLHGAEQFIHQERVLESDIGADFVRLDHVQPALIFEFSLEPSVENGFADEVEVVPSLDPGGCHAVGVRVEHMQRHLLGIDQIRDIGFEGRVQAHANEFEVSEG